MELSSAANLEYVYQQREIIKGVAVIVRSIPEINLSFLSGILVRNRLELIASTTYVKIEIKAPINAALISMKVSAAKTVVFSTDSKLIMSPNLSN